MKRTEFKINEYLSLELVGSKTFIYVNGKKFRQCKYVLLNIPVDEIDKFSSINSIDEVINNLDSSLEQNPEIISSETEFWAHCSNLQAWAENSYNTDLLDSVLSFPLLKELALEGEVHASRIFREEVAKRLTRGNIYIIEYLIYNKYLDFLSKEELTSILSKENCMLFEVLFNIFKLNDAEQFSIADSIYNSIGKYLFDSVEKKLNQIFETGNVEELYVFFNYQMLDVFSNKEIIFLFGPPMSLLEKTINLLNNLDHTDIKIEVGLISKKIEETLEDEIGEMLLNIIQSKKINYYVLWSLELLKYLEKGNIDFLEYLSYKNK